ncbi:hypothetical protein L1F28_28025 [Arthrospira platensis NCB002]|uniref:hypothetical protein n=2 Tax=Limnospira platensis TaxID=118562 RepID=UPI0001D0E5A9|nr:hypothetical protein [Arthrospira platensis NCB002]QQW27485.1 hypothetical protein AP9108_19935 [Arthrospira sp. PCC 9108]BAI91952.1 hypothetical protein NIES39_K03050 [Arthrospira platensis NIES-39]BDT14284.1 hypothetical protein N39L_40070 [Arthrospira platensis NIES-39]
MELFNLFAKKSSQETKAITDEDMLGIVGEFNKSLPSLPENSEILEEISFDKVVSYLKSDRPDSPSLTQAAIVRQKHPEGTFLALVFLDENNHLIYLPSGLQAGRQIVAKKLNQKLSKFLGDRDFSLVDLKQTSMELFNLFAKKSSQETKAITDEDMLGIVGEFNKSLPSLPENSEILEEISFDKVVSYLKSDRPDSPSLTQAAIVRQKHPEGTFLALVFLDENNHLIYLPSGLQAGRQIVAKKLNQKLSKFLGDRDFSLVDLKQTSMELFNLFAKKSSQETKAITDEDMLGIVGEFNKSLPSLPENSEILEEISFDKVVSYLKSDRPDSPNLTQAAIIRQKHPEGTFLALVFLDENNHLIYLPSGLQAGRQIVAKKLNQKLSKFLGDRDFSLVDLKQTSIVVKVIKIVSIIIWTMVIFLVLFPLLGHQIMNQALSAELNTPSLEITPNMVAFGWLGNQQAFDQARQTAYKEAKQYAEQELDKWETELIKRIDTDFLNWYFSYFNQKKQELDVLVQYVSQNFINGFDQSKINEQIKNSVNYNLQREFARRVVSSKSAESKFNTIKIDTTELYLEKLSGQLKNVPKKYKIAEADWQQYLETIKVRLENEQGDQSLPVKVIGGYLTTKAVAKIAAMTSGKVVAGLISSSIASVIDPAVAVGLIALDYWDYNNGVTENKPRLREDLVESLSELKNTLLKDPELGVMSAVNELDEQIKNSV